MEKQVNRITNDLISRADAIEILATMQGLCRSKEALAQNSKIWQQIKNLQSAQQWHTGEPTEDGDYLCYKYGDDDDFNYFDVDTFYTHEGTVEYGTPLAYRGWQDDHDRVVAWMPLPEAPEVEE